MVRGRVTDGATLPDATIDVWRTNEDGFYDVQQKALQPDMNLRGLFTAAAHGRYWFRSVKPRCYPIPGDSPVGKMLAAAQCGVNRAQHVHFMAARPAMKRW